MDVQELHKKLSNHLEQQKKEYESFVYAQEKGFYQGFDVDTRDFTPNQYWFNLFFLFVMSFTTFWFIGLMIEACIVIMRRNSEARIKNYQKEKEASLASTQNESLED